MKLNSELIIYTDGSCLGNPGKGGWAAKIIYRDTAKLLSGGFKRTTNNRMEIFAAIKALETLNINSNVNLYTDSRYLRDAVEKGWLTNWKKKNWKKSDGKPVLNRDLWELLLVQLERHSVHLHWVEAHAGHSENEEVDILARAAASKQNLPIDEGFIV